MNATPEKQTPPMRTAGRNAQTIGDGLRIRFYTIATFAWGAEAAIIAIAAGFVIGRTVAHLMGATP